MLLDEVVHHSLRQLQVPGDVEDVERDRVLRLVRDVAWLDRLRAALARRAACGNRDQTDRSGCASTTA